MQISVILPTWNEAHRIGRTLGRLRDERFEEIIVADGGSTDETVGIAGNIPGVTVIRSKRGRASQMNAGARIAQGDVFLFLHADTILPPNTPELISQSMAQKSIGGRFRVMFDDASWKYRFLAFYTRFPFFSYGDQAFFVSKKVFEEIKGYDSEAFFEDVDFFRRMRRKGKVRILEESVITSARRFQNQGFFRQKMINLFLSSLAGLGVSPRPFMKSLYPDVR